MRLLFTKAFVGFALIVALVSCGRYTSVRSDPTEYIASLPGHEGGELVRLTNKEFPDADNGFLAYLPAGWESSGVKYPTIVWFAGHNGIGDSREDSAELDKLTLNGIPKGIKLGTWKPDVPFIVIMPQARWKNPPKHDAYSYSSDHKDFWKSLYAKYPIETSRVYLAGHSDGGGVAYWITGFGGDKSFFAASIPVAGNAFDFISNKHRKTMVRGMTKTPTWLFHGRGDNFVPLYMSVDLFNEMKAIKNPAQEVRLTVFPDLGHYCTDEIFLGDGSVPVESEFDPFDEDIYSWLLSYRRVPK